MCVVFILCASVVDEKNASQHLDCMYGTAKQRTGSCRVPPPVFEIRTRGCHRDSTYTYTNKSSAPEAVDALSASAVKRVKMC